MRGGLTAEETSVGLGSSSFSRASANFISRGADQRCQPLKWQHSTFLPVKQLLPKRFDHPLVDLLKDASSWSRAEPLISSKDPQLPSQAGGVPRHTHVLD